MAATDYLESLLSSDEENKILGQRRDGMYVMLPSPPIFVLNVVRERSETSTRVGLLRLVLVLMFFIIVVND
jgi:hypothetical protein